MGSTPRPSGSVRSACAAWRSWATACAWRSRSAAAARAYARLLWLSQSGCCLCSTHTLRLKPLIAASPRSLPHPHPTAPADGDHQPPVRRHHGPPGERAGRRVRRLPALALHQGTWVAGAGAGEGASLAAQQLQASARAGRRAPAGSRGQPAARAVRRSTAPSLPGRCWRATCSWETWRRWAGREGGQRGRAAVAALLF